MNMEVFLVHCSNSGPPGTNYVESACGAELSVYRGLGRYWPLYAPPMKFFEFVEKYDGEQTTEEEPEKLFKACPECIEQYPLMLLATG